MTVLREVCSPPRKKLCLSTSKQQQLNCITTSPSVDAFPKSLPPTAEQGHMAMPIETGLMGVGLEGGSVRCGGHDDSESPITALSNLGNTCFLNSVLYTLRFAPSFMHNLHHLALDLKEYTTKYSLKCCSLGRGSKSWSSKDLPSLSVGDVNSIKIQIATDKLHQLYEALHTEEIKDRMEPYHPHVFLHSLRDVNPIFEGNQQHDAHELLVCLLDNIRETCEQLKQLAGAGLQARAAAAAASSTPAAESQPQQQQRHSLAKVRASLITLKSKSSRLNGTGDSNQTLPPQSQQNHNKNTIENGEWLGSNGVDCSGEDDINSVGHNFISEYFEGVSLLRTTCLECEQVTQRKETFCDICVPITTDQPDEPLNVNKLYQSALITEEFLHDSNKYWCEQCMRYNEAKRCVRFETLPKLLTLQIKRFSSGYGSVVSKVNEHMPTPLVLGCFCEECESGRGEPRHTYHLYGVIMHLGATIASGHYVAYVRARDSAQDYDSCIRAQRKAASLQTQHNKSSSNQAPHSHQQEKPKKKLSWFRSKNNGTNNSQANDPRNNQYFRSTCRGAECCGVRLRTEESAEPVWLECDDETVRTISKRQLEEILAQKQPKNSALTPYLLFYARQ